MLTDQKPPKGSNTMTTTHFETKTNRTHLECAFEWDWVPTEHEPVLTLAEKVHSLAGKEIHEAERDEIASLIALLDTCIPENALRAIESINPLDGCRVCGVLPEAHTEHPEGLGDTCWQDPSYALMESRILTRHALKMRHIRKTG
jgi:hypothetical protein